MTTTGPRSFWTPWAIAVALGVATLFVAANLHLIAVSLRSQPDCVPHLKTTAEGAGRLPRGEPVMLSIAAARRRPTIHMRTASSPRSCRRCRARPLTPAHCRWHTAFAWLRAGWSDTMTNPLPSLLYGVGVFVVSILVVWLLYRLEFQIISSFRRWRASWCWDR